jgi:anaphase-promoting complex subunit 1
MNGTCGAGHLSCLTAADLYRYLNLQHDPTTVGILLGAAASARGTMDPTVSKMLYLHVPARHPNIYPELDMSAIVQSAALMGIGLIYEGTCNR